LVIRQQIWNERPDIKQSDELIEKMEERETPKQSTKQITLFIDEDDTIQKISNAKIKKLFNYEIGLPKYANKKIRTVHAIVESQGNEITGILQIWYNILTLDNQGKLDQNDMEQYKKLIINSAFSFSEENKNNSNIIDASEYFLTKRIEREYNWNPSTELETKIKLKLLYNK
jgi:hypothetical protein